MKSLVKRLLLLAFIIHNSSFILRGQTTPVLFSMSSLTGSAANYSILIQPDVSQGTPLWWGTNLIPSQAFTIQPVGGVVITNMVPWGYTITVDGWPRGVHIVVPVSTNTLNVVSLINTNQFSPLNLTVTNITVGGIPVAAGANVVVTQTGGTNFVAVTNGAFDPFGASSAATGALGSAAWTAASAYDVAGAGTTAAQLVTNGIKSAAYQATSAFDAAGAGTTAANQATNGLQPYAFVPNMSSNLVYYFDPYATNAVGQPNNPLAKYSSLDAVPTISLSQPATFMLSAGVYFFTNALTNVSVIGSGAGVTILDDTNFNGGSGGSTEAFASAFDVSSNNLVFKDFCIGFGDGGPSNTNYFNSIWYVLSGSAGCSNELVQNVYSPMSFPVPYTMTGGAPFDGWYDGSSASQQWTFDYWWGEFPWDIGVKVAGGSGCSMNMTWLNCGLTTDAFVSGLNPSGSGHIFYDASAQNNCVYRFSGCKFISNGATEYYPIQIGQANMTNCTIQVQASTILTANGTNDFYLIGKSTAQNLSITVTGSQLDTNWLASASSAVWKNAAIYAFVDSSGMMRQSGSLFIQTNTSVNVPLPIVSGGIMWNSNNALYWVTSSPSLVAASE